MIGAISTPVHRCTPLRRNVIPSAVFGPMLHHVHFNPADYFSRRYSVGHHRFRQQPKRAMHPRRSLEPAARLVITITKLLLRGQAINSVEPVGPNADTQN
uniref:Uncharacterized protein n=1 Tax=Physcomitrium patens TaxID=3218 RepID=A0A2K1JY24_PHYPA|nr:hypothetical protein PHYPA_013545 [Physcomitrium patens]